MLVSILHEATVLYSATYFQILDADNGMMLSHLVAVYC